MLVDIEFDKTTIYCVYCTPLKVEYNLSVKGLEAIMHEKHQ